MMQDVGLYSSWPGFFLNVWENVHATHLIISIFLWNMCWRRCVSRGEYSLGLKVCPGLSRIRVFVCSSFFKPIYARVNAPTLGKCETLLSKYMTLKCPLSLLQPSSMDLAQEHMMPPDQTYTHHSSSSSLHSGQPPHGAGSHHGDYRHQQQQPQQQHHSMHGK